MYYAMAHMWGKQSLRKHPITTSHGHKYLHSSGTRWTLQEDHIAKNFRNYTCCQKDLWMRYQNAVQVPAGWENKQLRNPENCSSDPRRKTSDVHTKTSSCVEVGVYSFWHRFMCLNTMWAPGYFRLDSTSCTCEIPAEKHSVNLVSKRYTACIAGIITWATHFTRCHNQLLNPKPVTF
jgi:hypothetical protein